MSKEVVVTAMFSFCSLDIKTDVVAIFCDSFMLKHINVITLYTTKHLGIDMWIA